ncbi:DUF6325 family protein [Streptomyces fildesensis]|uniref:DUF6325 family protein n=1 Tax=Streptomyces fildesensis TaxID=375757 RepID=A0ABW8CFF0_9ACTN
MGIGPVEYLVVAFPGSRFTGRIAPALADIVASRTVRILDITFVRRAADGTIECVELQDLDPDDLVAYDPVEGTLAGLFNDADIQALAQSVPPGSSAALIVWEDLWAVPLTDAVRGAGGITVAHEQIPAEIAERALAEAR